MNTTKKLALTVLTATSLLFASTAFADGKNCDRDGYKKKHGEYKKYKNCETGKNAHKGDKSRFIIGAIYSLEGLTKEQETKIDKYMDEFQKARTGTLDAFSKDGFDKEAFIEARTNKKENMIKAKADLIEKIYSILTKEQKEKLVEKLENYKSMKKHHRG